VCAAAAATTAAAAAVASPSTFSCRTDVISRGRVSLSSFLEPPTTTTKKTQRELNACESVCVYMSAYVCVYK